MQEKLTPPLSQRIVSLLLLSVLFTGCAFSSTGSKSRKSSYKKSSMPKVPPKQVPGGTGDNWRYLGTSQDKMIALEINESSISKTQSPASGSYNIFQDRKTVIDPSKFNYQGLTPSYKYSLSWWQMDCSSKRYSISSTSIYDVLGNLIKTYPFNNTTPNWSNIDSGSLAELQYNYICLGINRSIGY